MANIKKRLRALWMTHLARKKCAMGRSTKGGGLCERFHRERAACFKKGFKMPFCRAYSGAYRFVPNRGYVSNLVAI